MILEAGSNVDSIRGSEVVVGCSSSAGIGSSSKYKILCGRKKWAGDKQRANPKEYTFPLVTLPLNKNAPPS
jgi:hypothetical protein